MGFYGDSKLQAENGLWDLVKNQEEDSAKTKGGNQMKIWYPSSLYDLWSKCEGEFPVWRSWVKILVFPELSTISVRC